MLQTIVWWIDNFELDSTSAFVKSVLHVTSNKQRLHLNYDGHLYQQFETAFFTSTFNQNGKSYAVQKKNILCSFKKTNSCNFVLYFIRIIYKFKAFTLNWKIKDFFLLNLSNVLDTRYCDFLILPAIKPHLVIAISS